MAQLTSISERLRVINYNIEAQLRRKIAQKQASIDAATADIARWNQDIADINEDIAAIVAQVPEPTKEPMEL